MRAKTKEQMDIFEQALSIWRQHAVAAENKPAILEVLALLFVQIVSEPHPQNDMEDHHAR